VAQRVLLVHANPLQRMLPVPPYGLERIRTAAAAAGADVELLDPYLTAEDPHAAAARRAAELQPQVIGLGLRVLEDCIPIDDLDGAGPNDVHNVIAEVRGLVDALREAAPDAVLVLGGAGFSACPGACLWALDVPYGIVGAGEGPFVSLLAQLAMGREPNGVRGLVRHGQAGAADGWQTAFGGPTLRETTYAPTHGFPVRTRIGCAMACAYCTASAMERRHANGDVRDVVAEVEALVELGRSRGIDPVQVFFADDEFNLPGEEHAVAVLEALVDAGLGRHFEWRAYLNPTPFSDRFAELAGATQGFVSVTADSAADDVLARSGKPFRRRHLDELLERTASHGVRTELGLIFGLPGESEATLAETIAFVRGLRPDVEVAYAVGARAYPNTPLGRIAEQEPERLYGAPGPRVAEPTVYSAVGEPRALARRLEHAFADLPHVERMGVGYARSTQALSHAYRAALAGDRDAWAGALDRASREPGPSAARTLAACLRIALWHERFDLAGSAVARLRRADLPPDVSGAGLLRARVVLGAMGRAQGLRRRLRTSASRA
jgi:hypothetical protein